MKMCYSHKAMNEGGKTTRGKYSREMEGTISSSVSIRNTGPKAGTQSSAGYICKVGS